MSPQSRRGCVRSYSFVGSLGKRIVMMITNGTITVIIIISMKGTRHFAMGTNKDIYWSPFPRGWHWCRNQYHSEASEVRWVITLVWYGHSLSFHYVLNLRGCDKVACYCHARSVLFTYYRIYIFMRMFIGLLVDQIS